ncbi:MAG TPA: cytochrome c biogenesis protein CcsA [Gemmatimonadaceae bacterium]|nr:cytochrome c biogenesis protein CcsA [Gemmatimonadaceae bacterium]
MLISVAHALAVSAYVGAAALAAAPLARPVQAPVRWVIGTLALGVAAHAAGLVAATVASGTLPLAGLGPALSVAGFLVAATLLVAESLAREVTLTLAAAPLAALCTAAANLVGLHTVLEPGGVAGAWLGAHIAMSFIGIAAYATAAAAGAMYLLEHHELKSRRFGALFRLFPPLQTLDRVNYLASVGGWLGLTVGVALATAYAVTYHQFEWPKIVWSVAAWLALSAIAVGRVLGGVQARRAALLSSVSFVGVVVLYLAARAVAATPGRFL